jgi:glutamyl-tRNA reductase
MPTATTAERISGSRMRIAMVGCNHRTAPLELRERVVFSPEQARQAAAHLRANGILHEAVVVSTCNRSELYGVCGPALDTTANAMEVFFYSFHNLPATEVNGKIYRETGDAAVRHLFRVTSGLDSMLLGEAEILGQVREAYTRALENGSTGPVLNRLFQGALEVGKRVRAETEVGARPMSVAFSGVKLAERVFGNLKDHRALILGAGVVAEQVVDHLRNRGIRGLRVVNRSRDRAEDLARRFQGESIGWESLESALEYPDIVVTSVGEAGVVLTRAMLERALEARSGRAMFVMDLGVPRNVEGDAGALYNLYLYNIDDLGEIVEQNRKAREAEIPRAEAIITEHIGKFGAWRAGVDSAEFVEQFRAQVESRRREFVAQRLEKLPPEEREAMTRLSQDLLDSIFAEPTTRLKKIRNPGERLAAIDALRRLFAMNSEDAGDARDTRDEDQS